MWSLLSLLAAGLAFLALLMVAVWLLSKHWHNAGIVDVAWSASFTPVAMGYAWLAEGWLVRDVLLVAMVSAWSLRLAAHLARRVWAEHPREDSRYAALRSAWGSRASARMLAFFEAQAVVALVLSVPFAVAALHGTPMISWVEWAGVGVWAVGVTGEATADWQLARFRHDPANAGRVCDHGLWRYSRHPNYFFEWITWCGFALFALGSPGGWLGVHVVPLMFWVLRYGTGVPHAEASSLRSRGDAYRAYQRTTSPFVPLPRRA